MDVERVTELATASSEETTTLRITRHGKLRFWVKKALDFFEVRSVAHAPPKHPTLAQSHPSRPLVLYSPPADVSASTIARLVSVVEIIKREYLKGRDVSTGDASGLHQYNQLLFEERGRIPVEGDDRSDALHLALDGRSQCVTRWCCGVADSNCHSVKQSFAPHMKITLSTKAITGSHEKRET